MQEAILASVDAVQRRTPDAEQCTAPSWTLEVRMLELAACQSAHLRGGQGGLAGVDAGHIPDKDPRLSFLARVHHVVQSPKKASRSPSFLKTSHKCSAICRWSSDQFPGSAEQTG